MPTAQEGRIAELGEGAWWEAGQEEEAESGAGEGEVGCLMVDVMILLDFGIWVGPPSPLALLVLCTRVLLSSGSSSPHRGHLLFCPRSSSLHRDHLLLYPGSRNLLRRNLFVLFRAFRSLFRLGRRTALFTSTWFNGMAIIVYT